MTDRIQVALKDREEAERLRALLLRTCSLRVDLVALPDLLDDGVVVMHSDWLADGAYLLPHPEKVIVVSPRDGRSIEAAWNAGIRTVVYESDPISTLVLAVMAAQLANRPPLPGRHPQAARAAAG